MVAVVGCAKFGLSRAEDLANDCCRMRTGREKTIGKTMTSSTRLAAPAAPANVQHPHVFGLEVSSRVDQCCQQITLVDTWLGIVRIHLVKSIARLVRFPIGLQPSRKKGIGPFTSPSVLASD